MSEGPKPVLLPEQRRVIFSNSKELLEASIILLLTGDAAVAAARDCTAEVWRVILRSVALGFLDSTVESMTLAPRSVRSACTQCVDLRRV